MKKKIAVIGDLSKDFIFNQTGKVYEKVGGTVFYACRALSFLGVPAVAVPALSENDSWMLKSLDMKGIEIVPVWSESTTQFTLRYSDVSERILEMNSVFGCSFDLKDDVRRALRGVDGLLWGFLSDVWDENIENFLSSLNCISAVDIQGWLRRASVGKIVLKRPQNIEHRLSCFNIVKADEVEAKVFTEEGTAQKAALFFNVNYGVEALITLGEEGVWLGYGGCSVHVPAYKVDKADTTGCGDMFTAAYLSRRLDGMPAVAACRDAAKAVAELLAL